MADNDKPPVVKLAQPGYDVKTAGDENLIYSSAWPLLKIYKQGSVKFPAARLSELVKHDLGFIPFFWYFANTPIDTWGVTSTGQEARSEFMGPIGDGSMQIFADKLQWTPPTFPAVSGNTQAYYYIFALDITKEYIAPQIKVGGAIGARDTSRVFKVAKEGKDYKSDNLFDFILHSRARSPLIHSVNPSPGVVKSFTAVHNLGYLPMFFAFVKNANGSYSPLPTGQGGSSSLQSTDKTVVFNDTGGKEVTIVILKDPFLLDYTVNVTI